MVLAGATAVAVLALLAVLFLGAGVVTLLKAKWGSLIVGLFVTPVWIVAALRLARPHSWWARRIYGDAKVARAQARATSPRYRTLVVGALVLSLLIPFAAFGFLDAYRIPGAAMEDTLRCPRPGPGCSSEASDRVLTLRYLPGTGPERGEIVAYRTPSDSSNFCPNPGAVFMGRIIGLAGDVIQIRDRLYVNNEPREEPYVNGGEAGDPFGPITVREGEYFLMGDNRYQSCDSREFGTVPRRDVMSRAVAIYWPLDRLGIP